MVWPPVHVTCRCPWPVSTWHHPMSSRAALRACGAPTQLLLPRPPLPPLARPHHMARCRMAGPRCSFQSTQNTCQRPQSSVTSLSRTSKGNVCCFRPREDGSHPALGGRGRSAPLGPYAGQHDTLNVGDQHGFLQTRSAPADQLWQAARKSEGPGSRTARTAVAVGQRPPGLTREHRANQQYAVQQTCGPGRAGGHLWHSSLDLG